MSHIKNLILIVAIIVMALGQLHPAHSAIITVNSFAQSPGGVGDCTLGEAIQAANTDTAVDGCPAGSGSDIINLPFGTYALSAIDNTTQGDNGLPDLTSNITINGTGAGPGATLITRAVAAPPFRIFHIAPTGVLSLNNLTLDNGEATATFIGGAIHNNQGTLNILNCSIVNSAAASGGGISNFMGPATITDSSIMGNRAVTDTGGGINNAGGIVNLTNSTISNNNAIGINSDGGGIHNSGNGTVNILSCTVDGNNANDAGGGLYNNDGTATITASTFANNHALGSAGGAIINGSEFLVGTLSISNSTITGNQAATDGGAIASNGIFNGMNITVSGNGATNGVGGGIAVAGTITITNSIIAFNVAGTNGPDCAGTVNTANYNLIGNITFCTISSGAGNLLGANPQLGPLQDNGGPTHTQALLPGSQAIDAGTNVGVAATDQRGFPRISNGIVDMGAYEVQVNVQEAVSAPTMNEWGTISLVILLGMGSICYLKRRTIA